LKKYIIAAIAVMFTSPAYACDGPEDHQNGSGSVRESPSSSFYKEALSKFTKGGAKPSSITDMGPVKLSNLRLMAVDGARDTVFLVSGDGDVVAGVYQDSKGRMINEIMARDARRDAVSKLNESNSFKIGKGTSNVFAFTDPDCPGCRSFEKILKSSGLLDRISVTYAFYPLDFHKDARRHSKEIWCSGDRHAAIDALMVDGKSLPSVESCDYPFDQVKRIGNQAMVRGTPTLILPNGDIVNLTGINSPDDMFNAISEGQ